MNRVQFYPSKISRCPVKLAIGLILLCLPFSLSETLSALEILALLMALRSRSRMRPIERAQVRTLAPFARSSSSVATCKRCLQKLIQIALVVGKLTARAKTKASDWLDQSVRGSSLVKNKRNFVSWVKRKRERLFSPIATTTTTTNIRDKQMFRWKQNHKERTTIANKRTRSDTHAHLTFTASFYLKSWTLIQRSSWAHEK